MTKLIPSIRILGGIDSRRWMFGGSCCCVSTPGVLCCCEGLTLLNSHGRVASIVGDSFRVWEGPGIKSIGNIYCQQRYRSASTIVYRDLYSTEWRSVDVDTRYGSLSSALINNNSYGVILYDYGNISDLYFNGQIIDAGGYHASFNGNTGFVNKRSGGSIFFYCGQKTATYNGTILQLNGIDYISPWSCLVANYNRQRSGYVFEGKFNSDENADGTRHSIGDYSTTDWSDGYGYGIIYHKNRKIGRGKILPNWYGMSRGCCLFVDESGLWTLNIDGENYVDGTDTPPTITAIENCGYNSYMFSVAYNSGNTETFNANGRFNGTYMPGMTCCGKLRYKTSDRNVYADDFILIGASDLSNTKTCCSGNIYAMGTVSGKNVIDIFDYQYGKMRFDRETFERIA